MGALGKGMISDGVVQGDTSEMSGHAVSCFGLCAFMHHITDKFYISMRVYALIKFIGPFRSFMQSLYFFA